MADMSQFLDKDMASIERPPTLPEGEYGAVIVGHEFGKSQKKQTPYVQINFKLIDAKDSVDPDEFAKIDLEKAKLNEKFYLTEDSLFRVKDFLETIGIEAPTIGQALQEIVGTSLNLVVGHEQATDGSDRVYTRIARFAAAD